MGAPWRQIQTKTCFTRVRHPTVNLPSPNTGGWARQPVCQEFKARRCFWLLCVQEYEKKEHKKGDKPRDYTSDDYSKPHEDSKYEHKRINPKPKSSKHKSDDEYTKEDEYKKGDHKKHHEHKEEDYSGYQESQYKKGDYKKAPEYKHLPKGYGGEDEVRVSLAVGRLTGLTACVLHLLCGW